jgi:hypothetical protein
MDKYEQRRTALEGLIDQLGFGAVKYVAANIGKSSSYVSRMLYPTTKKGFKRIGEDTVDLLNASFPGWIDAPKAPEVAPIKFYTKDRNAHAWVQRAIKHGYLPKPSTLTCLDCGQPAQVYDHRDYNKPLDVEPVCHACNIKRGPALPFVHVNDR